MGGFTENSPLMNDEKYNVLFKAIQGCRDEIAEIDRDLEGDRRELQNFQVNMATLKEEVAQLRKALSTNVQRVQDKVQDVVDPAVEQVDKLRKEIKNKKTMVFRKPFNLFDIFKRR